MMPVKSREVGKEGSTPSFFIVPEKEDLLPNCLSGIFAAQSSSLGDPSEICGIYLSTPSTMLSGNNERR